MAKVKDDTELNPVKPPVEPEITKIEEKVEEKVEKVQEKVVKATGKRQDLIGDLKDPKVDEDFDFKTWAKSVDERLDKALGKMDSAPPPESAPPPAEPPPKVAWYDRELI
jgi:hypothetical protein